MNVQYQPFDEPFNRTGLGSCQEVHRHGDWGPRLASWQNFIFSIEMLWIGVLLIKQGVFKISGDYSYLQLNIVEVFERVAARSSRFSWYNFSGVKRTVGCIIFCSLFLSWAYGRWSGLLVPTTPDVWFGTNATAFWHPNQMRPNDVLPANSWATAVWLFFYNFITPGISQAVIFHALLVGQPAQHDDQRLSALLQAEPGPGQEDSTAHFVTASSFPSLQELFSASSLPPATAERREYFFTASYKKWGENRPALVEYLLSFTVYLLFHFDMWHSNPIYRDYRYLIIAMGAWLVCQELLVFTQSIWPAALLRWIGVWTWLIFFGGNCYFWQGPFAGSGA